MPRRKYKSRLATPDLLYQNVTVAKLINIVMKSGKKTIAEHAVYGTFEDLKKKGIDPIEALEKAVYTIGPKHIVKPRRIGGASYMVPRETTPKHRLFLALRWLVDSARGRNNKEYHTFQQKLTQEISDAIEGKGAAVEKKIQTEKLAEANKVFAHFGW